MDFFKLNFMKFQLDPFKHEGQNKTAAVQTAISVSQHYVSEMVGGRALVTMNC